MDSTIISKSLVTVRWHTPPFVKQPPHSTGRVLLWYGARIHYCFFFHCIWLQLPFIHQTKGIMSHFQQDWNLQYKYYIMYMQHSYTQIELEYWQSQEGPRRALCTGKFTGAMIKFFRKRSKVTFKVTRQNLQYCRKGLVIRNTHAKYECPIS